MTRLSYTLAAIVLAAALTATASANILSNPGFELGTGADATDWSEMTSGASGMTIRSDAAPHGGSYHAYMSVDHVTHTPSAGAYFFEQNMGAGTIDNTLNYDLSLFAKVDSTDFTGVDVFYQVLWLDQDGSHGGGVKGEMLTSLIGQGINTDYQSFGASDIDVPDGTDSYLVRVQLSAGPIDNIVQGLYVDDVVLAPVPEPASLMLLGLAGAFLARRR